MKGTSTSQFYKAIIALLILTCTELKAGSYTWNGSTGKWSEAGTEYVLFKKEEIPLLKNSGIYFVAMQTGKWIQIKPLAILE